MELASLDGEPLKGVASEGSRTAKLANCSESVESRLSDPIMGRRRPLASDIEGYLIGCPEYPLPMRDLSTRMLILRESYCEQLWELLHSRAAARRPSRSGSAAGGASAGAAAHAA